MRRSYSHSRRETLKYLNHELLDFCHGPSPLPTPSDIETATDILKEKTRSLHQQLYMETVALRSWELQEKEIGVLMRTVRKLWDDAVCAEEGEWPELECEKFMPGKLGFERECVDKKVIRDAAPESGRFEIVRQES
jgi:hypothetical protein